ncbi:Alpha-ketoglutarate-dependent taurine dioxygenase [Serratia rubidaea]|uniref:Alpha-ketoglutarate-dependent taurine dioxygenase n=1 Tax=Serratia rubidaea TaxID=61652 RepID=A0A448S4K2_SERRU|nr:TauD/TfdA family dioxygenase [Serratia rubidaea]MBH1931850.1 TauD/TfdA family dioxygenase [Serratia rubidaea]MDC6121046.1 TauD/TfdA family dioxygenase [Serratia rubidaea]MEB7587762.1 TauD/TfdA family dioxygenase [Serratia rubidaea]QPR65256.1 TauD/TfdA family dioxygenase [Serratia rubidaea]CAI0913067.1 Alpha-ketoglutarate-dependent taurine dioxygenase [Serratia rubidaea]
MDLSPLNPSFGLEIKNIDLRNLAQEGIARLKEYLYEKKLLVIREQHLNHDAYLAFAEKLGSIAKYPFSDGIPGYPQIVQIKKNPEQTKNFSGMWHVDSTYLDAPPDITMLSAEVTPPLGGDTVFSNTTLAFDKLSEKFQQLLVNLECNYISDLHDQDRTKHLLANNEKRTFKAIHPAIKKHPITQKSSIYVNQEHTHSFVGMSREESLPVIDYLTGFIKNSEFTLRVSWQKGTIVLWDNRAVQHHAVNDYTGHLRIMHRITLNDSLV